MSDGADVSALRRRFSFWSWFWRAGARRLADRWLVLHLLVGAALAYLSPSPLSPVAATVLLPAAAILVGMTFAWSGNVAGLLQRAELQDAGGKDRGAKFDVFVYTYQAAILLVLVTIVAWTLVAMGIGMNAAGLAPAWLRFVGRFLLFAVSSVTLRECWQGVVGVHVMLLMTSAIRDGHKSGPKGQSTDLPQLPERTGQQDTLVDGRREDARVSSGTK